MLVRTGKGGRDGEYKAEPASVRRDLLSAARRLRPAFRKTVRRGVPG